MLNVTRPPANYRRALGAFKQAFRDERNFNSFVHMACALIIVRLLHNSVKHIDHEAVN